MSGKRKGNRKAETAWQSGRAGRDGTELVFGSLKVRKDGTLVLSDCDGIVLAAQPGAGAWLRRVPVFVPAGASIDQVREEMGLEPFGLAETTVPLGEPAQ